MIICKKCKHENYIPGARFCTSCGNPLKQPSKKLPEKNAKETIKEVQISTLSENMSDTLFL
jgi:ribosomal protein L37E